MESKVTQPRETFSSETSFDLGLDSERTVGLTKLDFCNSIFIITDKIKNYFFYTDFLDEFSVTELKKELKETPDFQNFSREHLQGKILNLIF